jgi:hypothetical protein
MLRSVLPFLLCASASAYGAAPEPWLPLNGGAFVGHPQSASPDPLVTYAWPAGSVNDTLLQTFTRAAVSVGPSATTAASSFLNASSAVGSEACAITVAGNGTLVIDWGVEMPAWFEFDSYDLADADAKNVVTMSISEYTVVEWQVVGFYERPPTVYGKNCGRGTDLCTYRLETNSELYEGVRYGFITLSTAPSAPFTIANLRAVSQAKAVNYTGSFSSAGDPMLEQVWYTAAYTTRAALQSTYFGSILMDRGDRFSWTGDAHASQAAAMAAFSYYSGVLNNLNRSKTDCQGIMTYCVIFILSVSDYYTESGDAAAVTYFTPQVVDHLDTANKQWDNPEGMHFVGWDDRTGSGFSNATTPETQNLFRLLTIRAFSEAAAFFGATGNSALSAKYAAIAANRTADIRAMGGTPWYGSFGLHAGADAVNAGFLTLAEQAGIAAGAVSDIVKLPSQSNFNQYFILRSMALLGQLDRAVESIRIIWGATVQLGGTTFWETSHPSAAMIQPPGPPAPAAEQSGWVSYCHPWSSGPTPWLSKWILGVRPTSPGYSTVLIAPHVAHSMRGVGGRVGTPHGTIELNVMRAVGGRAEAGVELSLPAGVQSATVRLSSVLLTRLGVTGPLTSLLVLHGAEHLPARLVRGAESAPLLDESNVLLGRADVLEVELTGGRSYDLRVRSADADVAASAVAPWTALASPFPPPSWPGAFVGSDYTTQGSWSGVYGSEGYVLLGFDSGPANPFCGVAGEGSTLTLQCTAAGAVIDDITFASFGTPADSVCPSFSTGQCDATSSSAVVKAACVGKASCSVNVSVSTFGDPCDGTSKELAVVAHCSSGGGTQPGATNPTDRTVLPPYVTSVVVPQGGFCGARGSWSDGTADVRALQDPAGPTSLPRHIGFAQPCGCPTFPIDITLTDAAIAEGHTYRLSAYFVDWAPSPACSTMQDGEARSQEIYILSAYPDLSPVTERQFLTDFTGGVWMSYELSGSVRFRSSTSRGDYAVISALVFDPVP